MSRIGNNPVVVPAGVEVTVTPGEVVVKGPLGTLKQRLNGDVLVEREGNKLLFKASNKLPQANTMSGTLRALIANMIHGVTKGFEKKLTLVGVGFRAQAQGDKLNLTVGYAHPVVHQMPKGIKVETPSQTDIVIKGADKQQVGQMAAEVRAYRKPESYKGKGVRYVDEVVNLKETKKK